MLSSATKMPADKMQRLWELSSVYHQRLLKMGRQTASKFMPRPCSPGLNCALLEGNHGVLGWQTLASFFYVWIETYPNLTMHPVYSSHHIKCTLFPGQLSTCHFWWFLGNWGFVSKVQSGKEHANFQVVSKHHTLFGRGLKEPLASRPFLRG